MTRAGAQPCRWLAATFGTWLALSAGTPLAAEGGGATHRLLPGERVRVDIRGQPDLSGTYELDRDGTFEMPLIGRVDAYRVAPADLRVQLVAAFADGFLREPVAEIEVPAFRPVFVVGRVLRPGPQVFVPGSTVKFAVERAGGAIGRGAELLRVRRGAHRFEVAPSAALAPGDAVEVGGEPD
ncbi:MAG: polysaccharide biosynthesis/export family protein [Pseudomonadota bacterium]